MGFSREAFIAVETVQEVAGSLATALKRGVNENSQLQIKLWLNQFD